MFCKSWSCYPVIQFSDHWCVVTFMFSLLVFHFVPSIKRDIRTPFYSKIRNTMGWKCVWINNKDITSLVYSFYVTAVSAHWCCMTTACPGLSVHMCVIGKVCVWMYLCACVFNWVRLRMFPFRYFIVVDEGSLTWKPPIPSKTTPVTSHILLHAV